MASHPAARVVPVLCLAGVALAPAYAQSRQIAVVLPGQTLVEGVGVSGTPDTVVQRDELTVHLFVVDASFDVDSSYEGPLTGLSFAADVPPPGEPPLPEARRFATSVSGAGAATALGGGSLRVSLGGSPFHEIQLGSPTSAGQVCDAIVAGIRAVPEEEWGLGSFGLDCAFAGGRYVISRLLDRAYLASDAGGPASSDPREGLAFDPTFGAAPLLHLGAPVASSNPADPAEFTPRAFVPPILDDRHFVRGHAAFRVRALHVNGTGQSLAVDQGAGPALPVVASQVTVDPLEMAVTGATAKGDGNGNITHVLLAFNQELDAGAPPVDASEFSLVDSGSGLPPIPGTGASVTQTLDQGFAASRIEVMFGAGIAQTNVTNLEIVYQSPIGLTGAASTTPLTSFAIGNSGAGSGTVPLVDGAPPVIVNTFAEDTDANGGLDVLHLEFSEPVRFSAGRGMSYGGLTDPADDPGSVTFAAPAPLRVVTSDLAVIENEVPVVDEGDPDLPIITGAAQMAASVTEALRRESDAPAWAHATAEFENGRYILRSGSAGAGSSLSVVPSVAAGDLGPVLGLGVGNGGVERPGHDGIGALEDFVVLSSDGTNLLFGQPDTSVTAAGSTVSVELANVPGSGTATPTFIWHDNGDGGFVSDRAARANAAAGTNTLGLSADFDPRELLAEASSVPGPHLTLERTEQPGNVVLDASPTIVPTGSHDDEVDATFSWRQVDGPFVQVPPTGGLIGVVPQTAGTYVFELTVSVPDATGTSFNPFLDGDRTLKRKLVLTVEPGPQADAIVLLPGQTLVPGVTTASEAVSGTPLLATEGVPFVAEVVATDAFFNESAPAPGAMARVTTTDPDDVEPAFTDFDGSRARLTITPSGAATTIVPEVDDEVLVAFEQGDAGVPYLVGSSWEATASAQVGPGGQVEVVLHWDADPRALQWNVYRGLVSDLRDFDRDGLPDLGYGTCRTSTDPDPTDEEFADLENPAAGDAFFYVGTMVMDTFGTAQETSPGLTSAGIERPRPGGCP